MINFYWDIDKNNRLSVYALSSWICAVFVSSMNLLQTDVTYDVWEIKVSGAFFHCQNLLFYFYKTRGISFIWQSNRNFKYIDLISVVLYLAE